MSEIDLTDADRRLLRLLQRDARSSTQDLASAAGMSSSPAWRRLRRLEELGVIKGQVALLDQHKLGLLAMAHVRVSLTGHSEATVARFDAFVQGQPQIVECARVTGDFDYVLKIVARDIEAVDKFLMHQLLALGIVRTTSTSIVLRQIKSTTELPLE